MSSTTSPTSYGLKLIRFKERDCYILLQNENGPCPLLAACNALILQAFITLPTLSIENGSATLEDVTNILADYALHKTTTASPISSTSTNTIVSSSDVKHEIDTVSKEQQTPYQSEKTPNNDNSTEEMTFCMNELLNYIPKFQYGMDVNPKFTVGITGYEYTAEVTAFVDMLQCKLVHGWLVNPFTEPELYHTIGQKSYNELIDQIISCKGGMDDTDTNSTNTNDYDSTQLSKLSAEMDAITNDCQTLTDPVLIQQLHTKVEELQKQYDEIQHTISSIHIIDHFLKNTSHQLTSYGLEVLHEQLQPDEVCVFFRNNHFNTMYKHPMNHSLYLLIIDMGYSLASNIVWEKLDVIDGDTELVNDQFTPNSNNNDNSDSNNNTIQQQQEHTTTPNQQTNHVAEDIATTDPDLHLALQLSMRELRTIESENEANPLSIVGQQQTVPKTPGGMFVRRDESDSNVAADANNNNDNQQRCSLEQNHPDNNSGSVPEGVTASSTTLLQQQTVSTTNASEQHGGRQETLAEAADRMLAMQMQEHQQEVYYSDNTRQQNYDNPSLRLARQLQEEEDRLAAAEVAASEGGGRSNTNIQRQGQQRVQGQPSGRHGNISNRVAGNADSSSAKCCVM